MLDFLRKRKRSWIITFLLGLIIVVFVAFYGGSQFQDGAVTHVATVNGELITQREFAQRYQQEVNRYRELFRGSFSQEMLKGLQLEAMILDDLVTRRLALQEARRLGITVTDEELAGAITNTPEFQLGGSFNKDHYLRLLRANRISPADFEDQQREQLMLQRLYQLMLDSVRIPEAELRERYRFGKEKINLHFIRLPLSDFSGAVKLTDEEIKNYYDRHQAMLKEPPKIQVEYLSYPFDKFAAPVQVTDQEIESYYQRQRDSKFRTPRQAKVKYISIRLASEASAEEKKSAKARADRIIADARGGKDFDQLIKDVSANSEAISGGDAGWVVQGQLPPQLEKTVFSLAKGQVSDAIETAGVLQIVKIEDIKEATTQSLKEARAEITQTLTEEKAKQAAATAADQDRDKALSGADFATLAQKGPATLKVTRLFAQGEVLPEVGPNEQFYKTAFSMDVKGTSPVVEGSTAYYLLRLKEKKEASVPPLAEVRARIEKDLTGSKAQELLAQKANSLLDQLKQEKNIMRVAQKNNLKLEETGFFTRDETQVPKIGALPEAQSGGILVSAQNPVAEIVYNQKDAAYVAALKSSQPADMSRFEKDKDALQKQAVAEAQQRVLQRFIEGLKAKADIQIYDLGFGVS